MPSKGRKVQQTNPGSNLKGTDIIENANLFPILKYDGSS